MARIKIQLPDKMIAEVKIKVRITDINYGNHLGNDSLVSILHEARVLWLHSFGFSELDIDGVGLIMSDLGVEFKNESFYGDELTVEIYTENVGPVSFELYYNLTNQQNKLIAKAKTGIVCYDYEEKKVTALPEKLKAILG
ncbi:MAG: thioesterase family protein [Gloeobacteraceae cyanobacterium ES-bin-316]|nr:thioesterase family protein [Ferruginibacter sp.]